MATILLNSYCILTALTLSCFLIEVQPRKFTGVEPRRNKYPAAVGDSRPSVRKGAQVEDLYERLLAESGNDHTPTPVDRMITKANDNALVITISSEYGTGVSENAEPWTHVAIFEVTDPEGGENNKITCEIDDNHFNVVAVPFNPLWFAIDSAKLLDYETQAHYMIRVTCQDDGQDPRTATEIVNITVIDVNDNSPALTINTLSTNGEAEVLENEEPEIFVAYLSVYDADSGDNGRVECGLDNNHFRLVALRDTEYKIITTQVFDHELQAMIELTISCQDKGEEHFRRTTTRNLTVNIGDANDNAPSISLSRNANGQVTVKENQEPGAVVAYMSVYDADSGDNGRFECRLNNGHFSLVNFYDTEYRIVSAEIFDREDQREYELEVKCQDQGDEPRITMKEVTVNIEDVNDYSPVFFLRKYSVSIPENTIIGMPILRLQAYDGDTGPNADIYFALDQAAAGYFKVDPVTGVLSTMAVLHQKETPELKFNATAADHGSPPKMSHTPVNVTITEVNGLGNNTPVFGEQFYHFSIRENATEGTVVGVVKATTKESDKVIYSFGWEVDYAFYNLFTFDSQTGEIATLAPIADYEEKTVFVASLKAYTHTRTGYHEAKTMIDIVITEVNDHAPVITINILSPSREAEIRQNAEPGTLVAHVSVYDADNGDNGKFSCVLDDDSFRLVQLRETEFKIVTTRTIQHDYMLNIKCVDHGDSPLTTIKQLAIKHGQ